MTSSVVYFMFRCGFLSIAHVALMSGREAVRLAEQFYVGEFGYGYIHSFAGMNPTIGDSTSPAISMSAIDFLISSVTSEL